MKTSFKSSSSQQGSSLIEVLVTLVILMLGLLGLVGLMVQSQRSQMESYQRMQALVVLQDMVNRINTNRKAAGCYALPDAIGTGYAVPGTIVTAAMCPAATAEQLARTNQDIREWNNLLLGSTEKLGTRDVGAMLGARGCITVESAGIYQVSVVWQGGGATVAPPAAVTCGAGLYGDEALRRAVSVPLQIANLS
ncbi:MAG: type IV pilus modification protein PilV [Rhodoferax sp.]|jgi:type IV pilus assembly protein PilV|uniref:type IV pilus modification protein PilV n=1 Tax=Rhodoferax sp. TaxID=50421 RepID=UPI002731B08D|nr:type IV pilus modification protein PilV [Rhodoferax sp.]MDP1528872.1 type IV pilus modification protein PilV [Rhodoferax sp.]MDP1943558.1 type IV pilus modification protein PilV [Rhodoferax sp.]MDP2441044.1 type IV pilus modification protein PilV [Rhodoferax sp.]MDP3190589.1 type IV pilus modification protein PilV [Rhodoferax sp.]MDP3335243.1 type IV pilus modification protein PilV [Rhodoferax sp.]